MGRFSSNLADAQPQGFEVWANGDYDVQLGEPKPFVRPKKDKDSQPLRNEQGDIVYTFGVGILLQGTPEQVKDGQERKEVKGWNNMYLHSKEAHGMVIEFLAAAYGFDPRDAISLAEFKKQHDVTDLFVGVTDDGNPDGEMAEVFKELAGRRIRCTATITTNKQTNEPQNRFTWRPFS